jgi:hypothetical protein
MTFSMSPLLLNLVVQLPVDLSSQESETLLFSCSQAIDPEQCLTKTEGEEADARIERIDEDRFVVEVNLETRTQQRLISREFVFLPQDPPLERARALGLSLGLLARTAPSQQEQKEEPNPEALSDERHALVPERAEVVRKRSPSANTSQKKQTTKKLSTRWLSELGLGLGYEPGLDVPYYQGEARLGVRPIPALALLLTFTVGGSRTDETGSPMAVTQLGGLAGMGFYRALPFGRVGIELEAGARNMAFVSSSAETRDDRTTFVLRAQLPLHVELVPRLYFVVAAGAVFFPSNTQIYLNDALVLQTGHVVPTLNLGLGLSF